MKKIILLAAACLFSIPLWAQQDPLTQFFNKYESDTSFTIVNISPKMFSLFGKMNLGADDQEAQQVMDVAKKLTGLRIITKENAHNSMQLFHEANNMLSRKFEELMTVRDHGNDMKFLIKQGPDGIIHNLIMLVGGSNEFVAMSLTGDIDLNEISKIAGNMNIQGFNKLKDLKTNGSGSKQ